LKIFESNCSVLKTGNVHILRFNFPLFHLL